MADPAEFVIKPTLYLRDGRIIEVQGTAEKTPFTEAEFLALMGLARKGVARLVDLQKMAVA